MFKLIIRVWIVCLAWPACLAQGDMLILRDGDSTNRLYGLVEREDTEVVHFRLHPDMGGELKVIPRAEIITLVFNIDVSRLMELDPGDLAAYRDYGEELANQAEDPQARDLAIRLFLIVAYGANEKPFKPGALPLRSSAIRNLKVLARDDAERRAFDQLASLYQVADHDTVDVAAAGPLSITDRMRAELLNLLLALRTGNREEALRLTRQADVEQAWKSRSPTCRWDELSRIIDRGEPLPFQLERLLAMEVELRHGRQAGSAAITRADSWAVQAREHDPHAAWLPQFLDVTEYDPRQNVWCNGQWIRDPKQGK